MGVAPYAAPGKGGGKAYKGGGGAVNIQYGGALASHVFEDGTPRKFKTEMCKFFPLGQCTRGENCTFAHDEADIQAAPTPAPGGACFGPAIGKGVSKGVGKGFGKGVGKAPAPAYVGARPPPPVAYSARPMAMGHSVGPAQMAIGWGGGAIGAATKGKGKGKGMWDGYGYWGGCNGGFASSKGCYGPMSNGSGKGKGWDAGFGGKGAKGKGKGDGFKFKTEMCKFFPEGKCDRGENCTYAHSQDEIDGANAPKPVPFKTTMCKFFLEGRCTRGEACTFAHDENEIGAANIGAEVTEAVTDESVLGLLEAQLAEGSSEAQVDLA